MSASGSARHSTPISWRTADGSDLSHSRLRWLRSLGLGRKPEFAAALGRDFEVDTDTLRDAILRASCANAFYLPVVTKIDFFGRGYEPFDESEFSRRRVTVCRMPRLKRAAHESR